LDRATSGSVILNGQKLDNLSEDERAAVRNQNVGFIFQNFQLIPTLTALENVMVPMELRGMKGIRKDCMELLERVGLADRYDHYPTQLSGGEQQRISLARAFANKPAILFADEPTGNLDEATSATVENLIFEINKEAGTTLVMVTHDLELAAKTQRVIKMRGGKEEYAVRLKKINPKIKIAEKGRGRIGCTRAEQLCIGTTSQENWKHILMETAKLDFVKSIERTFYE